MTTRRLTSSDQRGRHSRWRRKATALLRLTLVAVMIPLAASLLAASRAEGLAVSGVPSLDSTSSGPVRVGQSISDTTLISGGSAPTGSISFELFGPDDAACASAAVFRSTVPVAGDGRYQSAPFRPADPGIYLWVASYSGDAGNLAVDGTCTPGGQSVAVLIDVPSLVTVASPAIRLGGPVTDSVAISDASHPTGTLTFKLFGPGDDLCATTPVFVSRVTVDGTGTYVSRGYVPGAPGAYRFVVAYSGDRRDVGQTSRCEAESQVVVVGPAAPTIATSLSPPVPVGQAINADILLTGGDDPTGTVAFSFFGPGANACSGTPLYVASGVTVSGPGRYRSPAFVPTVVGWYPFVATYSGDGRNAGAASPCAGGPAALDVTRAKVTISTVVSAPVTLGRAIVGTDVLSGGHSPTGTIVFSFFSPADPRCARRPMFSSVPVPVSGNGTYRSSPLRPTAAGTYHFIATYSGDANNAGEATGCSAFKQSIQVMDAVGPSPASSPSRPSGRKVIRLEISAFTLISVIGASGAPSRRGGQHDPENARRHQSHRTSTVPTHASRQGSVAAVGIDDSKEGWEGVELLEDEKDEEAGDEKDREARDEEARDEEARVEEAPGAAMGAGTTEEGRSAAPPAGIGDRSRTWRWPGTERVDRLSANLPLRAAPASPTLALVLNDGGYLRAMLGSASALLPVIGVALGLLAAASTHGRALPPEFFLAMALAVLSVLDSLAGFVGTAVFVAAVVAHGGLTTLDDLRVLLGLSTLWFAAPLIAGTARPLRRAPSSTPKEHWDRMADVVIASLIGAWAVEQILQGLPGLAGRELPIADKSAVAAAIVLAGLAARLVLETMAAHWYPTRLRQVQPGAIPGSSAAQHHLAALVGVAIFAFVAVPYVGPCWQLWVGGALFLVPPTLRIYKGRFPNAPRLYAVLPQGILRAVVLLVVGGLAGAVVLSLLQHHPDQLVPDSFVLLSLPGLAFSVLDLFAREGEPIEAPNWLRQVLGTVVLAAGLMLVVGVISI